MQDVESLLTRKELASLLSCSLRTISRLVSEGKLACVKVNANRINSNGRTSNSMIRFRKVDIERFIKENLVPAKRDVLSKLGF